MQTRWQSTYVEVKPEDKDQMTEYLRRSKARKWRRDGKGRRWRWRRWRRHAQVSAGTVYRSDRIPSPLRARCWPHTGWPATAARTCPTSNRDGRPWPCVLRHTVTNQSVVTDSNANIMQAEIDKHNETVQEHWSLNLRLYTSAYQTLAILVKQVLTI